MPRSHGRVPRLNSYALRPFDSPGVSARSGQARVTPARSGRAGLNQFCPGRRISLRPPVPRHRTDTMHDPLIPLGNEPPEPPPSRGFGWITFVQIVLLLVVGGLAGYAAVQALKEPACPHAAGDAIRPHRVGRAGQPCLRDAGYAAARSEDRPDVRHQRRQPARRNGAGGGPGVLAERERVRRIRPPWRVRSPRLRRGAAGARPAVDSPRRPLVSGRPRLRFAGPAHVLPGVRDADWEDELDASTTPTSRSRPLSPWTARSIATSASTSAARRPSGWCPKASSAR